MIYTALCSLTEDINNYFRSKLKLNEDVVVLSGIVNQDGTIAIKQENKIIITLVNIQQEPVLKNSAQKRDFNDQVSNEPLNLNVHFLFSAFFNNYGESLKFLYLIISYLHHKPVFTAANSPGLHPNIEKLIFEMNNRDQETLNNMWSALGAKYMPSVLYKMKMLTLDESVVEKFIPGISIVKDQP